MNLKGSVTITRVRSNQEDDFIEVRLEDKRSGITFATAKMTLADFALAVTSLGFVKCDLEVYGLDRVGMVRENKTEQVFVPQTYHRDRELAQKAISKFEVDGWSGRVEDAMNTHRRVHGKQAPKGKNGEWYNVHFTRHVPFDGTREEELELIMEKSK